MTKYHVCRDVFVDMGTGGRVWERLPHHEQPADGFPSWTEAEIWLQERFLPPHIWRVEPFVPEQG